VALTREGASVMSSVQKNLAFLDSELVASSVAKSTVDLRDLLKPGITLFLQIPPEQLEAQRGLLRCWLSTMIRVIGSAGDERSGEVLCLLDEASALNGLSAVEEALVRGRSAGVRLLLAYQSDSQVTAAFKDKPTLLYDNCSTKIYLGASSFETAERLSKSCGEWTQVVESASESTSQQRGREKSAGDNTQMTWNWSRSWQPQARALLRPEELLTMSRELLIVLIDGMPPVLARRIKYYADPLFGTARAFGPPPPPLWWVLLAGVLALLAWAVWGGR
jgi:type IV secretion system protein VirD4